LGQRQPVFPLFSVSHQKFDRIARRFIFAEMQAYSPLYDRIFRPDRQVSRRAEAGIARRFGEVRLVPRP
jgi:hypothetical protein